MFLNLTTSSEDCNVLAHVSVFLHEPVLDTSLRQSIYFSVWNIVFCHSYRSSKLELESLALVRGFFCAGLTLKLDCQVYKDLGAKTPSKDMWMSVSAAERNNTSIYKLVGILNSNHWTECLPQC